MYNNQTDIGVDPEVYAQMSKHQISLIYSIVKDFNQIVNERICISARCPQLIQPTQQ